MADTKLLPIVLPPVPPELGARGEELPDPTRKWARIAVTWDQELVRVLKDAWTKLVELVNALVTRVGAAETTLTGLSARAKDVYTFVVGTPALTQADPGYAAVPLDVVADGALLEIRAKAQTPVTGPVTILVAVDATILPALSLFTGDVLASVTTGFPADGAVTKGQTLKVGVTQVPVGEPGGADLVVQVFVK
jgi:hypothetical protein